MARSSPNLLIQASDRVKAVCMIMFNDESAGRHSTISKLNTAL